jgi:hypothetical protein
METGGVWTERTSLEVRALLISLSTASLILPPIFLQKYLGIDDEPLLMFLDWWAVSSTLCFGLVVLLGIGFHWASAKRVKQAWGRATVLSGSQLERVLDALFALAAACFVLGVGFFLVFITGA